MECPVCKNVQLLMSDRQGIEIDYCPNCRGVWLDRGELDKIIERSVGQQPAAAAAAAPAPAPSPQGTGWGHSPQPNYPQQQQQHHQPQHGYPHPHHGYHKKKKKEGFLSDLFDFD